MKAAVYYEGGGPEVLKYEEVDDPEVARRHVLIEVHAVSIEGGDVLARGFGPAGPTPRLDAAQEGSRRPWAHFFPGPERRGG